MLSGGGRGRDSSKALGKGPAFSSRASFQQQTVSRLSPGSASVRLAGGLRLAGGSVMALLLVTTRPFASLTSPTSARVRGSAFLGNPELTWGQWARLRSPRGPGSRSPPGQPPRAVGTPSPLLREP